MLYFTSPQNKILYTVQWIAQWYFPLLSTIIMREKVLFTISLLFIIKSHYYAVFTNISRWDVK